MFDIGFWEMAFIGVIALVVIGPERLPQVARSVGSMVGKGRRMMRDVKADIKSEMSAEELQEFRDFKREMSGAKEGINSFKDNVRKTTGIDDIKNEFQTTKDELNAGLSDEPETLASTKTSSKKASSKKTAKKSTAKKKSAKKTTAKRAKKSTAKKTTAKKTAAKKSTAKKSTATKAPAKKSVAKKAPAKKSGSGQKAVAANNAETKEQAKA